MKIIISEIKFGEWANNSKVNIKNNLDTLVNNYVRRGGKISKYIRRRISTILDELTGVIKHTPITFLVDYRFAEYVIENTETILENIFRRSEQFNEIKKFLNDVFYEFLKDYHMIHRIKKNMGFG